MIDEGRGPAVRLIHAGVAASGMWRYQIGLQGLWTAAFDKRGFGQDPSAPGPYSDTDDFVAVLDQLRIDPTIVVGCSMGGATALDLVIDHPERVERLVLIGTFPSGRAPERRLRGEPARGGSDRGCQGRVIATASSRSTSKCGWSGTGVRPMRSTRF
ncbi:MAG: alpha/beta hydrolase [Acidimicrobiia bacterium]